MLILFDLMDTLLTDPYIRAHEAAGGCTFAEFEVLRPSGVYHRLELGEIVEAEYWRTIVESGLDWDVDEFHRVRREGYAWIDGMRALVADCVAANQVVIASNYPDWVDEVARDHLDGLDLRMFASCRLGVRKPSSRFFDLVSKKAGVAIAEMLLVDDKPANVEAMTSLGGRGVHFISAPQTREALRREGAAGV